MENGRHVIRLLETVVQLRQRIALTMREAANDNALAAYYALLKPRFPVTPASFHRRERVRALLMLACIASAACAYPLARANVVAGMVLLALCILGIMRLHRRRRADALARERDYFFTVVRAPADTQDEERALFPYLRDGWEIHFLDKDRKRPAAVCGNPEDLRPYDLLDAVRDALPEGERARYAALDYDYVP